jgi:phosphopantetheine--protein transferase-like protein
MLPRAGNVIGVGLDVEAVASLPPLGDAFYAAHFTPRELERAGQAADAREHLAGIWAAKEAARKAVPDLMSRPVTDLEVGHDADGRPSLSNPASVRVRLHVSISHAAGLATAIVIAVE